MGSHNSKTRQKDQNQCGWSFDHQTCVPCFFLGDGFSYVLRKAVNSTDPIGSPLPDTPDFTRQKRRHVQAALRNKDNVPNGSREEGAYSCKCVGSGKAGEEFDKNGIQHKQKHHIAPIYEGPTAEKELHDRYQVMEELGIGSTCTVHRCVHKQSGQEYACKIIDCILIEERFQGMLDQFHREIEVLRELHHPFIVQLYDVFITSSKIYIVMEVMEGGELFDYVVQKGTLTEHEAADIVRMICSAVVYMHERNIMHRDLKPENLLLKEIPKPDDHHPSHEGQRVEVKLIDFGLCKAMEEPVTRTFLGTRGYLAPEMLQRQHYTKAVDAWALGVIVFVLLCGCLPFDDDSSTLASHDLVQAKFVLRFPRWANNLSESAKHLLKHLLDVNPRTRFTAEQALYHPWTQGKTADDKNMLLSPARIKNSPAFTAGKKNTYPAGKGGLIPPAKNGCHMHYPLASPSDSDSDAPGPAVVRKKSI